MVRKLLNRIEFASYVATPHLAAFRILLGLFCLFLIQPDWIWLGGLPSNFFFPPRVSFTWLLEGFWSPEIFMISEVIFYVLLLFIIIGLYTRVSFILLFIVALTLNSFTFSLGKIDHNILFWLLFLCMGFTNSGTSYAVKKDKKLPGNIQNMSLALFSLSICFGLFSAGFPKLLNWVDFDLTTNGFLRWYYNGYFNLGRKEFLMPYVTQFPKIVLELFDYFAVMFEVSAFIFLIKGRNSWRIYLLMASVFHLSNIFLLNIDFKVHQMVYSLFLISPFLDRIFKITLKHSLAIYFKKALVILAFSGCLYVLTNFIIFTENSHDKNFSPVYLVSILFWLVIIIVSIFSFNRDYFKKEID